MHKNALTLSRMQPPSKVSEREEGAGSIISRKLSNVPRDLTHDWV
jgi:hypothetical protein